MIKYNKSYIFIALSIALILCAAMLFVGLYTTDKVYAEDEVTPVINSSTNTTKDIPTGNYNSLQINRIGGMSLIDSGYIYNSSLYYFTYNSGLTTGTYQIQIPSSVRSITGYGWGISNNCYNYIDYDNKTFVQNVYRLQLSSLNYSYDVNNHVFYYNISSDISPYQDYNNGLPMINSLVANYTKVIGYNVTYSSMPDISYVIGSNYYGRSQLYFKDSNYSSVEDFKSHFVNSTSDYIYYQLATPIVTDISQYLPDTMSFSIYGNGNFNLSAGSRFENLIPSTITWYNSDYSNYGNYTEGYTEGYDVGYNQGVADGTQSALETVTDEYARGYDDGQQTILENMKYSLSKNALGTSSFATPYSNWDTTYEYRYNDSMWYAYCLLSTPLFTTLSANTEFKVTYSFIAFNVENNYYLTVMDSDYHVIYTSQSPIDFGGGYDSETETYIGQSDVFIIPNSTDLLRFCYTDHNGNLAPLNSLVYMFNIEAEQFDFNSAIRDSYQAGYDSVIDNYSFGGAGYLSIYNAGKSAGINEKNPYTFGALMSSVIEAPLSAVLSIFNFEFLGYNMKNFVTFLLTLCVILAIVRLFVGGNNA